MDLISEWIPFKCLVLFSEITSCLVAARLGGFIARIVEPTGSFMPDKNIFNACVL